MSVAGPHPGIGIATACRGVPPISGRTLLTQLGQALPGAPPVWLELPVSWTRVTLSRLAASHGLEGLALVASRGDARAADLRGAPPLAPPLRVFWLPEDGAEPAAVDKLARELSGWARAVRQRPAVGPAHLRSCLVADGAAVSRRDLWGAVTRLRHEIVPAVDAARCVGAARCGLCPGACPHGAISVRDDRAVIDPRRCTGCGGCLVACPLDAIRYPGATKAELDAGLQGMLSGAATTPGRSIVAFTCSRWLGALPPPYLECSLPCVGSLSPWAVLRALSLGAAGVAVITADSPCRDRHDRAAVRREVRVAQSILAGLGLETDRIAGLDAPSESRLAELSAAVAAMGPAPWSDDGLTDSVPVALGDLVARMVSRMPRATAEVWDSPEVPFASVEVDAARCSLCGLCALCPTGAITHRDGPTSSTLTFHYAACTGCGVCRRICPEKAIRLSPAFVPARLAEGPRRLLHSPTVRCQSCRRPIGPAPMLDVIRRRLAQRHGPPGIFEEVSRLCPACRLSVPLGNPGLSSPARPPGNDHSPSRR